MIFCQMKVRVKLPVTETLYLDQAATVRTDKPLQLHIPLTCPQKVGVWNLEAADAALALQQAYPQESVTMLGPDTCYVHRVQVKQRDWSKPLRTVAAFAVLMFGSALGLAWFHSDVDMPRAMEQLFTLLTGNSSPDARCAGRVRVLRDPAKERSYAIGGEAHRVSGGYGADGGAKHPWG